MGQTAAAKLVLTLAFVAALLSPAAGDWNALVAGGSGRVNTCITLGSFLAIGTCDLSGWWRASCCRCAERGLTRSQAASNLQRNARTCGAVGALLV